MPYGYSWVISKANEPIVKVFYSVDRNPSKRPGAKERRPITAPGSGGNETLVWLTSIRYPAVANRLLSRSISWLACRRFSPSGAATPKSVR